MRSLLPNENMLEGVVERVVFRNRENGWTVLRLSVPGNAPIQTVVGAFQEITPGENVRFSGKWVQDAKHGRQFRADTCLPLVPQTLKGIEKFLGSGLIPGIGPVMAERMVKRFGLDALEVIEHSPERLTEVEGIGRKRARAISKAMIEKREVRDVMVFLESAGVSPAYAARIYKKYGKRAIRLVNENPYRLASEVSGIGFVSADRIARHLGFPLDSPHRAEAGLLYTLEDASKEGHTFAPLEELLVRGERLLDIAVDKLEDALERLLLMGHVRMEGKNAGAHVYLPSLYAAETGAAQHLKRILDAPVKPLRLNPAEAAARAEALSAIQLAPNQRAAFDGLSSARVMVLTGGPGTGKTTLLKGLVACLVDQNLTVAMAAPTGRAARRMSESAGRDAVTLHRLLEYTPRTGVFERNEHNPLTHDVVVVDEVSMVDIELFAALLSAVKSRARLILVGDPDQLPSVGPGAVLGDLLGLDKRLGQALSIVRLTEIFRQAQRSMIVTGAHAVLHGQEPPTGEKGSASDLFWIEREEPEDCLSAIKEMVQKRIPTAFGFDPVVDVQVLTPMHKGLLGTNNLNAELKQLLNPRPQVVGTAQHRYSIGDKVMQVRNNYELEVYNGDIGRVVSADDEGEWVAIAFDDRVVRYPVSDLEQTTLAYACSIHKSQGSEYPVVVMPVHTQHFIMLQRNLLYTGITRGKKLVVLVGTRRALRIAIKNDSMAYRCSSLTDRVLRS